MKFVLKNKTLKSSPVYGHVRKTRNGKKIEIKYPTGFSVNPEHWDSTNQKVKGLDESYNTYNSKIKKIRRAVEDIFDEIHFSELDNKILREKIDIKMGNNRAINCALNNAINGVVTDKGDMSFFGTFTRMQREIVNENYSKSFRTVKNKLLKFRPNVTWENINYSYYKDLIVWFNEQGQKTSYLATIIGRIILVMKRGVKDELHANFIFTQFDIPDYKADAVYLNEDEIVQLYKTKGLEPHIEKAKDLFIIGCWVGMRGDNYRNLKDVNINFQENTITYLIGKDGKVHTVEMHPMVQEVLIKYGKKLPKATKDTGNFNKWIREACKQAKINKIVFLKEERGGKPVEVSGEKWKFVAGHTARRSLCTNLYLAGFEVEDIMLVSGHETANSCKKYIKCQLRANGTAKSINVWDKFYNKRKEPVVLA